MPMHPANFSRGEFSNADLDSSDDTVLELVTAGRERLNLSFTVGVASLSAFSVFFRYHESGDWVPIASVSADYTAPEGPILGSSGDLTVAAFGATIHFLALDISGVQSVLITGAGVSSTVAGHYGMRS
ncbi:MAG: hypothetical protein KA154_20770 [Gemmatimonadaceae bacterium]|nr:hypothetical protein [Gemmatimonadaceae bacterium]